MKIKFLLPLLLLLSACSIDYGSEMSHLSSSISSSSSSEEIIEYEKDEEGFYILEDDYFSNTSIDDNKKVSKVRFSKDIDDFYDFNNMFRMYIGSERVPIYRVKTNFAQTWHGSAPNRMDNGVASIELEGKVNIKIQTSFSLNDDVTIRPLEANIKPVLDENRRVISFDITSSGQYTIEFRGKRTLHLFVNDYFDNSEYLSASKLIHFTKGVYNKDNCSYIDKNNTINLASNTTVVIDDGAIIQGGFYAYDKSNIKIVGLGIVDGSVFERDAEKGSRMIPFVFEYCSNIHITGITTLDPAGWTYNMYFTNELYMDNIKIISSRSNGDGISLQSCTNAEVRNCFVRSWDDSLVVKNYPRWNNKNLHGTTRNILFEDCILWTDLAQSMEIGFETVGEVMENIIFNNITVLHNFHKPPISIHNGNNAHIKDVEFKNITVEDGSMGKGDGKNYLIEFTAEHSSTWSDQHTITSLGEVDGVIVDNVKIIECNNPKVSLRGSIDKRSGYNNTLHEVKNITFQDVLIKDTILDDNYPNLEMVHTKNIYFVTTGREIIGAKTKYDDVSSYGSAYIIEAI